MANVNMWAAEWDTDGVNYWPKSSVESETRPSEQHYPVINERRVRGSRYTPYKSGSKEWRDAANRTLSSRAQANFQNGKR